jgi:hypothetical protein
MEDVLRPHPGMTPPFIARQAAAQPEAQAPMETSYPSMTFARTFAASKCIYMYKYIRLSVSLHRHLHTHTLSGLGLGL